MVYISAGGGVQQKRSNFRLSIVPELCWAVINFIGLLWVQQFYLIVQWPYVFFRFLSFLSSFKKLIFLNLPSFQVSRRYVVVKEKTNQVVVLFVALVADSEAAAAAVVVVDPVHELDTEVETLVVWVKYVQLHHQVVAEAGKSVF